MKASIIFIWLSLLFSCNQRNNYLLKVTNKENQAGYINLKGDTTIALGKYSQCFTDTFKKYAIVLKDKTGFVVIDRREKVLFEVFPFDNGPDYLSDGLFRVLKNGKIGFADSNFSVKISPEYGCAFPFENGIAKVSKECKSVPDGEHHIWVSGNWFYINKTGSRVKTPE